MHENSYKLMRGFVRKYVDLDKPLLVAEIGSMQYHDQPWLYRNLFHDKHVYLGIDIEDGPNVDCVLKNPYDWKELRDTSFDIIVSGQMLEHCEKFWLVAKEMKKIIKPGGLICLVAPWMMGKHKAPVDCWRILPDGMKVIGDLMGADTVEARRSKKDCIGIFKV